MIQPSGSVVDGAVPIIIGTVTIEGRKVMDLSKQTLDLGADATLVITPYNLNAPWSIISR